MFNNHTISLVHNLADIGPAINDVNLLAVVAITSEELPRLDNIHKFISLMPSTEILMHWADGDVKAMSIGYPQYLMDKDQDDLIVAMLALLTRKNIVIYISYNDFSVYGSIFLEHLYLNYGIIVNTPTTRFFIDVNRIPLIMCKFFMINVMSGEELLRAYPGKYPLPEFVINKLAAEMNPFNYPAPFVEYYNYFNAINASKEIGSTVMATIVK